MPKRFCFLQISSRSRARLKVIFYNVYDLYLNWIMSLFSFKQCQYEYRIVNKVGMDRSGIVTGSTAAATVASLI
jgi:hypothetical protein